MLDMSDIPYEIQKIRRDERNIQMYVREGKQGYIPELKKIQARIKQYEKQRDEIINDAFQLSRTKKGTSAYNGLLSRLQRRYKSYCIEWFELGDQRNYSAYEWESLIKKNITPMYCKHGTRGERALDKVRNPEKYYWNRKRDKEGCGVSAGYTAAMRDMQKIKTFNTKKSVGASSYPSSPVKFR